jgi:RNA polymerase sigma-70 factor (ECF subfamily)
MTVINLFIPANLSGTFLPRSPWLTMLIQHPAISESIVNEADVHDVRMAQGGDDHAFTRIVYRHQQAMARRLWRFTRDPRVLEELVQETFVEAWAGLSGYQGDAPFEHWLTRIATRVGYRHWKTRWKQGQSTHDDALDRLPAPPTSHAASIEVAEYVHHLLAQLPPRDRLILTLLYLEQCTPDETAHRTGWSHMMVKVQAHRARAKLRKLIEQTES